MTIFFDLSKVNKRFIQNQNQILILPLIQYHQILSLLLNLALNLNLILVKFEDLKGKAAEIQDLEKAVEIIK